MHIQHHSSAGTDYGRTIRWEKTVRVIQNH